MTLKVDKDFFMLIGLGRRLALPTHLSIEHAKELKLRTQERVMELW